MRRTKPARTLEFVDYIVKAGRPVATTDVANALDLTPPTAHRVAVQLEKEGFLRRAFGSKKLTVGPRLARLGLDITAAWLSEAPRHAILECLTREVGEQCELGIVQANQVVYVDGGRTATPASLHFEPGLHAPLHCTSIGKLFLASLSPDARRSLIDVLDLSRYTPRTIVDSKQLYREITTVQRNDFAMTNEEYVLGVVGCGVPVRGMRKQIVAGLAVSVPSARVAFKDLSKYLPALRKAADRLEATLKQHTQDVE